MAARVLLGIAFSAVLAAIVPITVAAQQSNAQASRSADETRLIQSLNGGALYQAYCAACHGNDGRGNGPAAVSLKNQPPDLTRIAQRSGGKFPSDRVQEIIAGENGIPAHGSRSMPVWGPIFGQIAWDQDLGKVRIYNLAKYLESLQQK
ncbi:MAG: cytochrome c [Acidobacteria bacterium]|nr:cytochrome c [Acidobacteriota bacterium]